MNKSQNINKTQAKYLFMQYDTSKKGLNEEQFKRLVYEYYNLQPNPTIDSLIHDMLLIADGTGFFNRHNGILNQNEFFLIFGKLPSFMTDHVKQFCRVIFEIIDKDHSQFLDKKELQTLFKKIDNSTLSKASSEALFSEYDINGDGKISFDEFLQIYLQQK